MPGRFAHPAHAALLLCFLLGSCVNAGPLPTNSASTTPDVTGTPASSITPTSFPTPVPSRTPDPKPRIYIAPDLPEGFRSQVRIPEGSTPVNQEMDANITIHLQDESPLSTWVYALVAPFPTIQDELSSADLAGLWKSDQILADQPAHLYVDPSTLAIFQALWGPPSKRVRTLPAAQLLQQAWQNPTDWALLPFETLEPRWKVITVDGQNPLHKDFDLSAYSLKASIGLTGDSSSIAQITAQYGPRSAAPLLPPTNRRADRLTTVVVTGVTALVRGTAAYMEQFGMDYPAREILPWLRDADILHISNEIAFAENCPSPDNWQGLKFCSQTRYIQLLDDIGTDVIDLAGDHFADWGPEAMLFSLKLYRDRGWKFYGGGETSDIAKQPALFDHNGNKIAFLGCNYKNPAYSTASLKTPGAVHCDPDWLEPEIKQVKSEGYLPIVTFQHEEYYEYIARPNLETDFRAAAAAGAVIVSGSQAHQPHALEFSGDSLLHYGLGNLFFDQVFSMDATNKAFIDRHVFYDGRYIGTELLTIIFVDYARSRPMTLTERQDLLKVVFSASRWGVNSQVK